jgi:transcriptional regulator with XRE-family HTH domain
VTEIGPALRTARQRRGWSRDQLAARAGVSSAAITQIETGRRSDPRLSSLLALAGALGSSLDQLVGGGSTTASLTHRALLYDDMDEFLSFAVPYLREGVDADHAPIAVTTPPKLRALKQRLGSHSPGVLFADSQHWYSSPISALNSYRDYVNGKLDSGAKMVRLLGEPVWKNRSPTDTRAWIRYESLVNDVFANTPATIVCPYDKRAPRAVVQAAQCTHPELAGDRTVSSASYRTPEELLLEP